MTADAQWATEGWIKSWDRGHDGYTYGECCNNHIGLIDRISLWAFQYTRRDKMAIYLPADEYECIEKWWNGTPGGLGPPRPWGVFVMKAGRQ